MPKETSGFTGSPASPDTLGSPGIPVSPASSTSPASPPSPTGADTGQSAAVGAALAKIRAGRRARALSEARRRGAAAVLVTKAANIRYLTGFSGSSATLLLGSGGSVLATDGRYRTQARTEVGGLGKDIRLVITRDDDWLQAAITTMLADRSGDGLGVEADDLSFARGERIRGWDPPVEVLPVTGLVEELRQRKDTTELPLLARACHITADAFEAMYGWLRPGMTEREVAHRLLGEMLDRGAEGPAFDFIVATGANGAIPHHRPTSDLVADHQLVTVDAGARLAGYCADMTRTIAVGAAPGRLRRVYDTVAQAQVQGVAACVDGAPAGDIDDVCRRWIDAAGYLDHVVHPTGHGVGLEIHEPPILSSGQAARLRSGMAVTVEPGIYLPGVGGVRIEDVVAITDGVPVPLTTPTVARPAARQLKAHALIEL